MNRSLALSRSGLVQQLAPMLRYATVGLINISVDGGGYALLTQLAGLPPALANVASFSSAIVVSYLLNREWTFDDRDRDPRGWNQFGRFLCVNLAGLLLSTLLVLLFVTIADALVAKLLSIPIVFFYNYSASSRFVFRVRRKEPAPGA